MQKTILQEQQRCSPQKNGSKKHQILEKWDNFENRPSCKGYSPCKGSSLFKIVFFGQKLQMLKTCKKTTLQEQHTCSVQKTARKNTQY